MNKQLSEPMLKPPRGGRATANVRAAAAMMEMEVLVPHMREAFT